MPQLSIPYIETQSDMPKLPVFLQTITIKYYILVMRQIRNTGHVDLVQYYNLNNEKLLYYKMLILSNFYHIIAVLTGFALNYFQFLLQILQLDNILHDHIVLRLFIQI